MRVALAAVCACGLVLAAVAIADPGSPHLLRLRLHASQATPPLALKYSRAFGATLVRVDAGTLRPRGRGLRLGGPCGFAGGYAAGFAFKGTQLALGGSFGRVCLVGTRRLRLRSVIDSGIEGDVEAVAWAGANLAAAINSEGSLSLVALDPASGRVVARREVAGSLQASAGAPAGLLLVLGPTEVIGPARLLLFAADGTLRTAALDRIPSGYDFSDPQHRRASRVSPGLAVDRDGNRAFVTGAGAPVAEIDLASMSVAYHDLSQPVSLVGRLGRWLEPAAEAKELLEGPTREAAWLGAGMLAVWGRNDHVEVVGDRLRSWQEPAGLSLIDTRDWTIRLLDRGATSATIANDKLLAFSWLWDSATERAGGTGLTAYGPDGSQRFHLFRSRALISVQVLGGRAFAKGAGSGYSVVDLRTARMVRSFKGDPPQLLLP
jgi:hypothetical protein